MMAITADRPDSNAKLPVNMQKLSWKDYLLSKGIKVVVKWETTKHPGWSIEASKD